MKVTNIVHPTYSKVQADSENRHFGNNAKKEGDIFRSWSIEVDEIEYKPNLSDFGIDTKNREAVESTFEEIKGWYKREYDWLLTRDQEDVYAIYRSAKILKTLQREHPEKFTVVDKQ